MRHRSLVTGIGFAALYLAMLAPSATTAQESHIKIVAGLEDRKEGSDIQQTRAAFAAHEDQLHRCFWERKTTKFPSGYESKVESEWRVAAEGGSVSAENIESKRESVVREPEVLKCFKSELKKASIFSGSNSVLLVFTPIVLDIPRTRIKQFKFTGKRPGKRLAAMVKKQVHTDRNNLCRTSRITAGTSKVTVKIQPNGHIDIKGENSHFLSCSLGLERDQAPVPSGSDAIEFTATVEVKQGPDRRPFEARNLLGGVGLRVKEREVRYQTQFGDVEVWNSLGRTSTNRLRSVCMAAAAQPEDKRFISACSFTGCECSTQYDSDNWGKYCKPYLEAGSPDKTKFMAQMFNKVLEKHRDDLKACGSRCATGAKQFKADCGAFMGVK